MTAGAGRDRSREEGLLGALRVGTRAAHDALDAQAGTLDLGTEGDLWRLLAMNEAALAAILRAAPGPGGAGLRALPALLGALRSDLRALGRPALGPLRIAPPDPWAAEYVVLGSRLGTRLLWRRRVAAAGPDAPAGRYLASGEGHPGPGPAFRSLCVRLARRPAQGPEAERAVASAEALFDLFSRALACTEEVRRCSA